MNENSGAFSLFVLLSAGAAALSAAGWIHGDWWGALALVMAMTFGLISIVIRLQGNTKNRLTPSSY